MSVKRTTSTLFLVFFLTSLFVFFSASVQAEDFFHQLIYGKVKQLDPPTEVINKRPLLGDLSTTALDEILQFYNQVEPPPEGWARLPARGRIPKEEAAYYKSHPDVLVNDIFRRIAFVKSNRGSLSDLADVFELHNRLRRFQEPEDADPFAALDRPGSLLQKLSYEEGTPLPIHLIVPIPTTQARLSLSSPPLTLPTMIRWSTPLTMQTRSSSRSPASTVHPRHRNCVRIAGGKFSAQYTSQEWGGPHLKGHPDAEWWISLFHEKAHPRRRVVFLVSVGQSMASVDPTQKAHPQSCQRFRLLQQLMASRWEGMSYALLPFSEGVIGTRPQGAETFYTWPEQKEKITAELDQWACASRPETSGRAFDFSAVVAELQHKIFGNRWQYGDAVVVFVAPEDPHYTAWLELSRRSEGLQAYASSTGILAGLDVALRSVQRAPASKKL